MVVTKVVVTKVVVTKVVVTKVVEQLVQHYRLASRSLSAFAQTGLAESTD